MDDLPLPPPEGDKTSVREEIQPLARLCRESFKKPLLFVMPAKAGIQKTLKQLDSRFRGNGSVVGFMRQANISPINESFAPCITDSLNHPFVHSVNSVVFFNELNELCQLKRKERGNGL
jgi:hypothetical protein